MSVTTNQLIVRIIKLSAMYHVAHVAVPLGYNETSPRVRCSGFQLRPTYVAVAGSELPIGLVIHLRLQIPANPSSAHIKLDTR